VETGYKLALTAFVVLSFVYVFETFAAGPAPRNEVGCTSTQEYVTALEYLRSTPELAISEPEARKVADRVLKGCSGAGQRFIRVSQVLMRAGVGGKDAIEEALDLSHKTDREAETFITVFRTAFASEGLDLDLRAALKMARAFSTEFEGDVSAVRDDFERLVSFCVGPSNLDLPRPKCADFAVRIARKGQSFSGGMSEPFIKAFDFIRSERGPGVPTARALEIAESLVAGGPGSTDNFVQGYRYAISSSGLALGSDEALKFAESMAAKTRSSEAH
jgi:hypothetical protein